MRYTWSIHVSETTINVTHYNGSSLEDTVAANSLAMYKCNHYNLNVLHKLQQLLYKYSSYMYYMVVTGKWLIFKSSKNSRTHAITLEGRLQEHVHVLLIASKNNL